MKIKIKTIPEEFDPIGHQDPSTHAKIMLFHGYLWLYLLEEYPLSTVEFYTDPSHPEAPSKEVEVSGDTGWQTELEIIQEIKCGMDDVYADHDIKNAYCVTSLVRYGRDERQGDYFL